MIDEINFMEKVERSSRSRDNRAYDQSNALYESIATRRSSRFQKLWRDFRIVKTALNQRVK